MTERAHDDWVKDLGRCVLNGLGECLAKASCTWKRYAHSVRQRISHDLEALLSASHPG